MNLETGMVLGVPVDNLTLDEAVAHIFKLVDRFDQDGIPKYVATVNVDFIVNTLSWIPGRTAHPELLEILRRADLVTADGMPVVWAARLLGTQLKERVTGADLVPAIAKAAAHRGKSIYLLGGSGDVGKAAAHVLQERFPGLQVSGTHAPFVHVSGDGMLNAEDVDSDVVEKINHARPDILFLGFGNPKQELWFQRNRHRLKTGVSIGIGGTYEFITGRVKRAPLWIQNMGVEWLFRITQDPMRLFKRYFVGFFKFGTMILPAILYVRYRAWRINTSIDNATTTAPDTMVHQEKASVAPEAEELSKQVTGFGGSVYIVTPPHRMDAAWVQEHGDAMLLELKVPHVIVDFSRVTFIDSTGIGFLVKWYRRFHKENRRLILCGVPSAVMRTFQLIRVIDLFREILVDGVDDALEEMSRPQRQGRFGYFMEERLHSNVIHFFGQMERKEIHQEGIDLQAMAAAIQSHHTLMNLTNVNYIDNSGILFLLKLQRIAQQHERRFMLCVGPGNVMQMLKISQVTPLFSITSDLTTARAAI